MRWSPKRGVYAFWDEVPKLGWRPPLGWVRLDWDRLW